ncbi:hypothetical protein ACA910_001737 [Epithemia clementina (nom. ined.)]
MKLRCYYRRTIALCLLLQYVTNCLGFGPVVLRKSPWQKDDPQSLGSRHCPRLVANSLLLATTTSTPLAACHVIDPKESSCDASRAVGFYVHIPYCRRRCRYCNFDILPIGQERKITSSSSDDYNELWNKGFEALDRNYTWAIQQELRKLFERENHFAVMNDNSRKSVTLRSIYFGGGTPSLAPVSTIQTILDAILYNDQSPFAAAPNIEITLEMDPGTFDQAKLEALRDLGVNRISLGIQSFSNSVLQSLGRQHTVKDVWESIGLLHLVYGDTLNYSIDLISGLPGVSLAEWAKTLHTAVNALQPPPNHVSVYDLQIEAGTVFGKWYGNGDVAEESDRTHNSLASKASTWHATKTTSPSIVTGGDVKIHPLPSDEQTAFHYQYTAGFMRSKGFEHYEVSSYARLLSCADDEATSPWRSQHNQVYWGYNTQWYAVGLGATSFVRGRVKARPSTLFDYVKWVREEPDDEEVQVEETAESSERNEQVDLDRLQDVVLKRLRTKEGLDLNWVRTQYGERYVSAILKGAELGLDLGLATVAESSSSSNKRLQLDDSKGFLFSNSIISSIFVELEQVQNVGCISSGRAQR